MAIDYKARQPGPKPRRRSNKSCGFWFFFGLVLGGFGAGFYLMLRTPIQVDPPIQAKTESPEPPPVIPTRFDFHDILPELEVVVSDNELDDPEPMKPEVEKPEAKPENKPAEVVKEPEAPKQETVKKPEAPKQEVAKKPEPTKPEPTKQEPTKSDGNTYMVQVASLRTAADAERLKAQLALQGIHAKVQSITVNGKDTYHRVQAGPYQGKQAVNQVRGQLKAKGMDTLAIKLK